MVRLVCVCLLFGCGRIRFDIPGGDGSTADDDGQSMVTCGDGTCSGYDGELCVTCMADCRTLAPVCGNGACDAGESPDCYADCGPSPWVWTADEQALLTMINDARVNGTSCPTGGPITSPPLTSNTTLELAAREWAWERVHQEWTGPGGGCNGRSVSDRIIAVNGRAAWIFDAATVTDTMMFILASDMACPSVLSSANTEIGVGRADDVATFPTFIMMLR